MPHPSHRELNPLDSPKHIEHLQVLPRCVGRDDDVNWRVNTVLEREHIPANITMGWIEHACVETTEDIVALVLCVGAANRVLELRSEVVPVDGVCGTLEVGGEALHE